MDVRDGKPLAGRTIDLAPFAEPAAGPAGQPQGGPPAAPGPRHQQGHVDIPPEPGR
jgi:hypothetical protein